MEPFKPKVCWENVAICDNRTKKERPPQKRCYQIIFANDDKQLTWLTPDEAKKACKSVAVKSLRKAHKVPTHERITK